MKQQFPSHRRIKKALRSLEQDLGNTLLEPEYGYSDQEIKDKLDFSVSYYVTWLFRKTDLPNVVWCDGILWQNDDTFVLNQVGENSLS